MYLELIVCRPSQAEQVKFIEVSPCQEKAPPSDWQLGTPQTGYSIIAPRIPTFNPCQKFMISSLSQKKSKAMKEIPIDQTLKVMMLKLMLSTSKVSYQISYLSMMILN